jgi:LruC domain-containing protein
MKSIKFLTFLALISLVVFSCRKTDNTPNQQIDNPSMTELIIPAGFDWATTSDVEVNLSISGTKAYEAKSKVYVFNQDPANEGQLLISGTATPGKSFIATMRIPSYIKEVFLKMESPFGEVRTATVPVVNNLINYSFNLKNGGDLKVFTEPVCDDDGDVIITQTSGTIDITDGLTYSLSGEFTGSVNFTNSGGTLKVCGNATFTNNVIMNKNTHHLIVTQGGSVFASNLALGDEDATISVYSNSSLTIDNNFTPGGYVYNSGYMEVTGSWNQTGNSGYFDNYGTIQVNVDMKLNSATTNYNGCAIYVDRDFNLNNSNCTLVMESGSYLEVDEDASFTQFKVEMYESAMIKATELFANSQAEFQVYGDAIIHVISNMNIDGTFDGPVTIAYEPGASVSNDATLLNGANVTPVGDVTIYLPVTACNAAGFGEPEVIDTDFDGIPDDLDEYPTDSQRASNSYFPALGIWGTVAFEDLWPAQGDYDFNDLILDYTGYYVQNADNEVKDLKMTFRVRAVGASFNNGFGLQFENITPDKIESVTGLIHESDLMDIVLNANGTEAGQSKAVIIPVESVEDIISRSGPGSMFNTIPGAGAGTYDEVEITITFVDPIVMEDLGQESINPFLIRNQNRGHEIHLPDMPPTDLANFELFGTSQDASNPNTGIYYKTKNNLPWAIMFSQIFDYPIELNDITQSYLKFAEWAQSSGTQATDWYSNISPGYRAENKIY